MRRLALVLLLLTACTAWSGHVRPLSSEPARSLSGEARLQLRDSTTIVLRNVTITADRVTGTLPADSQLFTVPSSQVLGIEQKSISSSRTMLLLISMGVGVLAVMLIGLSTMPID